MADGSPTRANPQLTIGIDARAAVEVPAGRGRMVRELLVALAERGDTHRYLCYARHAWDRRLDSRFRWELIGSPDPLWHLLVARAASQRCDVFLSSNSYLTVPLLRVPSVAIVYDLLAFDLAMQPNRRSVVIERLTLGAAVRSADQLVCISETTRRELLARYPAAATKASVALLGVSPELAAPPTGAELADLPQPGFVLAVGTLEPRKNLPRLVAAFSSLPGELQRAHPLVVVGARGWRTGPTIDALRSLGDRCRMLGAVSDAVLAELFRRCAVFCYPALGEGFGLPVLEAMAAGAAVLTSNLSSLPEVGGDAVQYADPRSVDSIAAALGRLLTDPARRAELAARGRERAARFSWRETADHVLSALVMASESRG